MASFMRITQSAVAETAGPDDEAATEALEPDGPDEPAADGPDGGAWRLIPWALGLIAAAATAAFMSVTLGTPALWRDESATTVAIRRTWPHLWQLFGGSEAPLVPYYAVLKVLTGWTTQINPASAGHVEALERWPSAAAVAIACGALVYWLARIGLPGAGVCSGGLFLLLAGVSRYGQEARPYAMVLMLAVLATVAWWRMVHDARIRWLPPYVLFVAAMVAMHALSASLLAAHVIAAMILRRKPGTAPGMPLGWLARVLRTGLAGAAGLAIASPLTKLAIDNGTGATTLRVSSREMLDVFLRLFNGSSSPSQVIIVTLWVLLVGLPVLAIVTGWRSPARANVIRLATAWALVPLGVLIPAAIARPNLVATRYLLFIVPGWVLLAGLGLGTLASGWHFLVPRAPAWIWPARVTSVVIVLAALAGCAVVQQPSLESVRSTKGHGEDVRVLLALAREPAYRDWPIEVIPPIEAIQLSAYVPGWSGRVINLRQPQDGPVIWPRKVDGDQVSDRLRSAPGVIIMVRGGTKVRSPKAWTTCRLITSKASDRKWSYYVLARADPHNGESGCPAS